MLLICLVAESEEDSDRAECSCDCDCLLMDDCSALVSCSVYGIGDFLKRANNGVDLNGVERGVSGFLAASISVSLLHTC